MHDYSDLPSMQLVPLADWHDGSCGTNHTFINSLVTYCLANEDCYAVGVGDLAENATRTSVGAGFFEENVHIQDQMDNLYELLAPLAATGRLWGLEEGNHCFRTTALLGLHPMKIVADRLGVPFLGYTSYHLVKVGMQQYRVFVGHNAGGGGRTMAAKSRAAENPKDVADCDIYITGHTHFLGHHRATHFEFDEDNLVMRERMRYFVSCGSALNYFNSYAEMSILPPLSIGAPLMVFKGGPQWGIRIIDD